MRRTNKNGKKYRSAFNDFAELTRNQDFSTKRQKHLKLVKEHSELPGIKCNVSSDEFFEVAPVIPVIASLMTSDDEEVLRDSCWALSYLSDDHTENNVYIQAVIDAHVISDLVRLLK